MTGLAAAIADPPQMDDPTPMRVPVFFCILSTLERRYATRRDTVIVDIIIGSDCRPVSATTERFIPNPRSMTAHWSTFFDTNLIPFPKDVLSFRNIAMVMPARIAMTGPPMIGKRVPSMYAGIEMSKHRIMPLSMLLSELCVMVMIIIEKAVYEKLPSASDFSHRSICFIYLNPLPIIKKEESREEASLLLPVCFHHLHADGILKGCYW